MTRVAAVDCGTNSVRLLVADVTDGTLTDVDRQMRVVRLGQGVDRTGRLAPEAIERTRAALVEYATTIRDAGADSVRMVATSATRDAENRADFVAMVRDVLGVEPDVVTGLDEAQLSFTGAASVLTGTSGDLLVIDIGGGSTELVRGRVPGGDGLRAHSMDVGSVRLTERHLADDPPTAEQVERAVADVRTALEAARRDVPLEGGLTVIGVAGTITTVAGLALGLERYESDAVDGATLTRAQVDDVTGRLLTMTRDERAAHAVIHPGRVDVITAGALVLRTVLAEVGADELVVSEHDILDGIALSLTS